MKLRLLIPVLGIIVAAGCGSMRRAPGVGNSNVLTRAELAASDQQDLYRLLQALRPQWLNSRGPTSFGGYSGGPSVYLDGGNVGGLEFLRNMPPSAAEEIRYWPSSEAATRFGMGHPDGVIAVKTRR